MPLLTDEEINEILERYGVNDELDQRVYAWLVAQTLSRVAYTYLPMYNPTYPRTYTQAQDERERTPADRRYATHRAYLEGTSYESGAEREGETPTVREVMGSLAPPAPIIARPIYIFGATGKGNTCHVCDKPFSQCECPPNLTWEEQFRQENQT